MKVTERGWGGHFICCADCLFRRNTLIEHKDKKIVVSTVGAMRKNGEIETIGHNRFYETMAFEAEEDHEYIEANVEKQIEFESECGIFGESVSDLPEGVDNKANEMHEAVVIEIKNMLENSNA